MVEGAGVWRRSEHAREDANQHPDDEEGTTALSRVIGMWLQWSSAYEEVSGRMFQEGEDTQKLEAMLDEMDQLRLEAVELSEDLLKD